MSETAFEAAANIRDRNVMSAHSDAPAHTRDCLFEIGKPEIMEFQFVA